MGIDFIVMGHRREMTGTSNNDFLGARNGFGKRICVLAFNPVKLTRHHQRRRSDRAELFDREMRFARPHRQHFAIEDRPVIGGGRETLIKIAL